MPFNESGKYDGAKDRLKAFDFSGGSAVVDGQGDQYDEQDTYSNTELCAGIVSFCSELMQGFDTIPYPMEIGNDKAKDGSQSTDRDAKHPHGFW